VQGLIVQRPAKQLTCDQFGYLAKLVSCGSMIALIMLIAAPANAQQNQSSVAEVESELRLSTAQLQQVRRSAVDSEKIKQEIADEIAGIEQDRDALTRRLLEANQAAQSLEASLGAIEARLGSLQETEVDMQTILDGRRDQLGTVLAALQRLGNNPPPTLIVRPENALEAMRSAILLAAVVPEMRSEMEAISADLAALQETKDKIEAEQRRHHSTMVALQEDNLRIDALMDARRNLLNSKTVDLQAANKRAAEFAERATSLRELVATLEADLKKTRAAALRTTTTATPTAAVAPSARLQPTVGFTQTRGQLKLPVRGAILTQFGETDQFGADSKGMTIATRSGARISSPVDGRIVYAGPFRSFGSVIIVNVGDGFHILLAGMDKVDVGLHQEILLGEPIGVMGSRRFASISPVGTGLSQPLLYIEFWENDKPIDSSPWWTALTNEGR
jgi:septal ring factor EnvC (AmiA/AmiB activator)